MGQRDVSRTGSDSICVVIPAYNVGLFVNEALESVLQQEVEVSEIVVVDDASTDETVKIVQSVAVAQSKVPIRLLRNERNQGVSLTRNRGIAAATSDYVAFLDPDDRWLAHHIRLHLQTLRDGADFTYSWLEEFGDKSRIGLGVIRPKPWERRTWPVSYFRRQFIYPSALCARKAVLQSTGGFPQNARIGEDWILMVQAILHGRKIVEIPQVTCAMRKHPQSATADRTRVLQRWWTDCQPILEEYPVLRRYRSAEHYRQRGYWKAHSHPTQALGLYFRAILLDPLRFSLWLRIPLLILMCLRLESVIPPAFRFLKPPDA